MGQLKDSIDMAAGSRSERYRMGQELRHDEHSPMHCDQCHAYLGVWRLIRFALFKKPGASYIIMCRCGHPNVRIKGAYR